MIDLLNKKLKKYNIPIDNVILRNVIILFVLYLISILLELSVFNFRHWETLTNNEETVTYNLSSGFEAADEENCYKIISDDLNIELSNLDTEIKTIYLSFYKNEDENSDEDNYEPVKVHFDATDFSHHSYYSLNDRMICEYEARSSYITMHPYGKIDSLLIKPNLQTDSSYFIDILVNPVIPIFFEWERVFLIFSILILIVYLRPNSSLYQISYLSLNKTHRRVIIALIIILTSLTLSWVNKLNPFYQYESGANTEQYQKLAEAFSEGSLSLLEKPNETLINMENPYDMSLRAELMDFWDYKFDHAYYKGEYYVYFGVVPVILLYLPYYLITGEHIHNHTVCLIGIILIILSIILLFDETIKKYYKKCSLPMWFMCIETMIMGSYIVYITKRPDLYSIPIIYAVFFALLGMWAFLKSFDEDRESLKIGYLFAGSLSTALIAGCRPQLFIIFVIDILILRKYIFSLKYLKSRDGVKSIIAVMIPMAVVAASLMIYNYKRFENPFDFGAFYNLTFNDMRNRGWVWDRVPYGSVIYLLRPVELSPVYPFFNNIEIKTAYMGETIQETTYGGILWACPISFFCFLPFLFRKKYEKKCTLRLISIAALLCGLIIMVFDTVNSGILARYFFDFAFLIMLSAIFAVWGILSNYSSDSTAYKIIANLLLVCMIYMVFYQMFVFMLDSGDYLMNNRKDLFYHYYYLFTFAL